MWPLVVVLLAGACLINSQQNVAPAVVPLPPVALATGGEWTRDVKPVLDRRCVVCHACADAPCQLQLSSFEGADRGASKHPVYHGDRFEPMKPTRLFVDEKTTADWRNRDFFSVLSAEGDSAAKASLMQRMLELARAHPLPPNEQLPTGVEIDINRTLYCPHDSEFDVYATSHPNGGMPFAVAPIANREYQTLLSWLAEGAPAPRSSGALPEAATSAVRKWETFLNGDSAKERVTSRYLYEHLFLAHLHFPGVAPGPYFRLVRSRTPSGKPIDEIATVRPYDSPGKAAFFYRLAPVHSTIVNKTHMVYALGDARMARYRELFLKPAWQSEAIPSYDKKDSANPFDTFEGMPARARYQFLLDDAHYFIMTFIKGPVCRGQIALNVIEDHFFVAFVDPDSDASVIESSYLDESKEWLRLPAENRSKLTLGGLWLKYFVDWRRYVHFRADTYRKRDPQKLGPSLDDLWDGDGKNDNALLTVFRHFDSATVVKGYAGEIPKTAWVVDYPILERIYYDLVAGFDVFGNVTHQLSTRLYMDYLRMESEDLFLSFLPADTREPIRDSWYVGAAAQTKEFLQNRLTNLDIGTRVSFATDDPKRELIEKILAKVSPTVRGAPDLLNRCTKPPCKRAGADTNERRAEDELRKLASVKRPFVRFAPDVAFLRVRLDKNGTRDLAYTLVHNEAHTNVAFMFDEDGRRNPDDDTLTVVRGFLGSYPNFFFDVKLGDLDDFVARLAAVDDEADFTALAVAYGVRRSSPKFWTTSDWVNEGYARTDPGEAGLFDLNRYGNY